MAKRVWTVRVVNVIPYPVTGRARGHVGLNGLWVEQLRYMGYCKVLAVYDGRHEPLTPEDRFMVERGETGTFTVRYADNHSEILEFYAPAGHGDGRTWADQNAERMRSFGINAAAAPKWGG